MTSPQKPQQRFRDLGFVSSAEGFDRRLCRGWHGSDGFCHGLLELARRHRTHVVHVLLHPRVFSVVPDRVVPYEIQVSLQCGDRLVLVPLEFVEDCAQIHRMGDEFEIIIHAEALPIHRFHEIFCLRLLPQALHDFAVLGRDGAISRGVIVFATRTLLVRCVRVRLDDRALALARGLDATIPRVQIFEDAPWNAAVVDGGSIFAPFLSRERLHELCLLVFVRALEVFPDQVVPQLVEVRTKKVCVLVSTVDQLFLDSNDIQKVRFESKIAKVPARAVIANRTKAEEHVGRVHVPRESSLVH